METKERCEPLSRNSPILFPELVEQIVDLVPDAPTLLSLCLVSRNCANFARRNLYSSVILTIDANDDVSVFRLGHQRIRRWHASVIANHELLRLLLSCTVPCHEEFVDDELLWHQLAEVLRLAPNLKILEIQTPVPLNWFKDILKGDLHLFQLTYLNITSNNITSDSDDSLVQFLARQSKSLHALILIANDATLSSLTPDICSQITSLGGPTSTIRFMLANRPNLKEIMWFPGPFPSANSDVPLQLLESIQSLFVYNMQLPRFGSFPPSLSTLSPYLNDLRLLTLIGGFTLEDLEEISKLPCLETFSVLHSEEQAILPEPLRAGLAHRCFSAIPTLCAVVFLSRPFEIGKEVRAITWRKDKESGEITRDEEQYIPPPDQVPSTRDVREALRMALQRAQLAIAPASPLVPFAEFPPTLIAFRGNCTSHPMEMREHDVLVPNCCPTLLPEVIEQVIDLALEVPTLFSLCLVSRHCANLAQKILYSSVILTLDANDDVSIFRLGHQRARRWHASLTINPRLAQFLISCTITIHDELTESSLWTMLAEILPLASNLKHLMLGHPVPQTWTESLLQGYFPFQLTSLHLFSSNFSTNTYDGALAHFLARQSESLRDLVLFANETTLSSLTPDVCSKVVRIGGWITTIKFLLNDRPNVREIVWSGGDPSSLSDFPLQLLSSIQEFTLTNMRFPWASVFPSLSTFSPYFSDLRTLYLVDSFSREDFDEITKLPRLEALCIYYVEEEMILPEPLKAGLACHFFSAIPALHEISFLNEPFKPGSKKTVVTWLRDQESGETRSVEEQFEPLPDEISRPVYSRRET
ncbi:hypothetical protein NP233_g6657 [Leucocoprinus birnbaumii]|uniref:F-box domain-containing protein n=1 Tax=Leucocoprinus birnbaumii TaxID=56174 RepID=A0AAD5YPT8_9AGAR|nr:hypothetical protein NP233_g6657 [Leucocoprinus birnbaumii]